MRPQEHVFPDQSPPSILPRELTVEILSWLPVKSLLRFRCVCKSWNLLICDPSFVKFHLQRSPRNTNLVLASGGSLFVRSFLENPSSTIPEDTCYLKDFVGDYNYKCVGSCNGLVCVVGKVHRHVYVRLWNPATRLRSEPSPFLLVNSRSLRFGYTMFGFGYDNLSDTYKVVVGLIDSKAQEDSKKTQVNIYHSGDNCWRIIQGFPAVDDLRQRNGVYLSGTLNWLAVPSFSLGNELVIVSLDLRKEAYSRLLLPCSLDEAHHVESTLGILKGCLCFSHDCKGTHFVVWLMKEFGVENSWMQLMSVSYQDLHIDRPLQASLLSLCMPENGDILIVMARPGTGGLQAILYNQSDDRARSIEISNDLVWVYNTDYVQSLIWPHSVEVHQQQLASANLSQTGSVIFNPSNFMNQ